MLQAAETWTIMVIYFHEKKSTSSKSLGDSPLNVIISLRTDPNNVFAPYTPDSDVIEIIAEEEVEEMSAKKATYKKRPVVPNGSFPFSESKLTLKIAIETYF